MMNSQRDRDQTETLVEENKYLDAVDLMIFRGVPEEDIEPAISHSIHKQKSGYKENEPDNITKI